jgi:UDP-glucose-4-epimerase GalE
MHERGHTVAVIDNLSRGFRESLPEEVPLFDHDVCDTDQLIKNLQDFNPDVVLHFAALADVGESVREPELYSLNNVGGTRSLIDALQTNPVPVVFSSTCAVYGNPDSIPVNETAKINPMSPYGETKHMCENLLHAYADRSGKGVIALRYFNACGASADGKFGEAGEPPIRIIPSVYRALRDNRKFTLYGNDFATDDGTCVRDYIHLDDLAEAHLLSAERVLEHTEFDVFNLGTGVGTSNLEVLAAIGKERGQEVPFEFGPRRLGDPARLFADPSKAKEVLGFCPKHNMDTIVHTSALWFRNHPNGYS